MADGAPREVVRRNFTFPKEFDTKIEKLRQECGVVSKSELLRLAITRLEEEVSLKKKAKETA